MLPENIAHGDKTALQTGFVSAKNDQTSYYFHKTIKQLLNNNEMHIVRQVLWVCVPYCPTRRDLVPVTTAQHSQAKLKGDSFVSVTLRQFFSSGPSVPWYRTEDESAALVAVLFPANIWPRLLSSSLRQSRHPLSSMYVCECVCMFVCVHQPLN